MTRLGSIVVAALVAVPVAGSASQNPAYIRSAGSAPQNPAYIRSAGSASQHPAYIRSVRLWGEPFGFARRAWKPRPTVPLVL
ncbi:MAG TPA: hypothetical protein VG871_07435, partial [Vicinamibacterales bacterium]|nr:hypothetical protein [Vicinamibacterales bacterium]